MSWLTPGLFKVIKLLYQAFSLKVTGVAKQVLASDLKPLGHQNLLGGWDVIHADELEIPPEVLLPIAHAQSERVAELIPAGMEGL